jgi:hypothetical protein
MEGAPALEPVPTFKVNAASNTWVSFDPCDIEYAPLYFPPNGKNMRLCALIAQALRRYEQSQWVQVNIGEKVALTDAKWAPVNFEWRATVVSGVTELLCDNPRGDFQCDPPTIDTLYGATIAPAFSPKSKFFCIALILKTPDRSIAGTESTSHFTLAKFDAFLEKVGAYKSTRPEYADGVLTALAEKKKKEDDDAILEWREKEYVWGAYKALLINEPIPTEPADTPSIFKFKLDYVAETLVARNKERAAKKKAMAELIATNTATTLTPALIDADLRAKRDAILNDLGEVKVHSADCRSVDLGTTSGLTKSELDEKVAAGFAKIAESKQQEGFVASMCKSSAELVQAATEAITAATATLTECTNNTTTATQTNNPVEEAIYARAHATQEAIQNCPRGVLSGAKTGADAFTRVPEEIVTVPAGTLLHSAAQPDTPVTLPASLARKLASQAHIPVAEPAPAQAEEQKPAAVPDWPLLEPTRTIIVFSTTDLRGKRLMTERTYYYAPVGDALRPYRGTEPGEWLAQIRFSAHQANFKVVCATLHSWKFDGPANLGKVIATVNFAGDFSVEHTTIIDATEEIVTVPVAPVEAAEKKQEVLPAPAEYISHEEQVHQVSYGPKCDTPFFDLPEIEATRKAIVGVMFSDNGARLEADVEATYTTKVQHVRVRVPACADTWQVSAGASEMSYQWLATEKDLRLGVSINGYANATPQPFDGVAEYTFTVKYRKLVE